MQIAKIKPALHLDWETYSECDLKDCGLYIYARHHTTDIWIASYSFDDEPVQTWTPREPVPQRIKAHIEAGLPVWAHNAQFEREICNNVGKKYGWPELKDEQLVDTMAMAYAMALPGSLEHAAPAMGLKEEKDLVGRALMLKMAKPDRKGQRNSNPDDFKRLIKYGNQDVVVEKKLGERLLPLSPMLSKLWVLDQKINSRGFLVDMPLVKRAILIAKRETEALDQEMVSLTGNYVASSRATGQLRDFVELHGIACESVDKAGVAELLARNDLPPKLRRALEVRQEAAKSSVKKLNKMAHMAGIDGRIRGTMQFHGASTGRFAGRGVQPHNFPRGKFKHSELTHIFEILATSKDPAEMYRMCYGSPMQVLSDALRHFIIARPGHRLMWVDFAAIEARVLAWLAGEESILRVFRGDGKYYEHTAGRIYHVNPIEILKDDIRRQIGKVASLALQYAGGEEAFQVMAEGYGIKISDEEAEKIKIAWREANPNIVNFWYELERQAVNAILNPKQICLAMGPNGISRAVKYVRNGSFLFCQLPSGRVMVYPYPRVAPVAHVSKKTGKRWVKNTIHYKAMVENRWMECRAYGGLLAENVTQGVAFDALIDVIFRLEEHKYPTIFHVHDEVVAEVPDGFGSLKEMEALASVVPTWAEHLPMKAEGTEAKRYRK